MNFARIKFMPRRKPLPLCKIAAACLALAALIARPVSAEEKAGMPDLGQQDQTCLPTSTANVIVWFGTHGYPKLIVPGDSADDGYIHTVHAIITATDATYNWGTRTDAITYGIRKYIHAAGYDCDVEYRGLDWSQVKYTEVVKDEDEDKYKDDNAKPLVPFTQDWLQENDDPNKGFILLLAYIAFDQGTNTFTNAWNAGHAVTLVNAEPDMILIHDPAHEDDEPGRKILTPTPLTGGVFELPGYRAPVAGLLLLSGSLLDTPPNAGVMLTGAVCITMRPQVSPTAIVSAGSSSSSSSSSVPVGAGNPSDGSSSTPSAPASPTSTTPDSGSQTWAEWLFDLIFKK